MRIVSLTLRSPCAKTFVAAPVRAAPTFSHSFNPSRRFLSVQAAEGVVGATSSSAAMAKTAVSQTQQHPSIIPKVIGFSVFSLSLGFVAISYSLMTDEAMLFWARDNYPTLVNALAPVLGLPQEVMVNNLSEEEEYQPSDIKEIVGDAVYVAAKMASGQVLVLQCDAHETPEGISKLALARRPGDRVLDVAVLEKANALQMIDKDPEELGREMNMIHIPDIPEVVSVYTLQIALELCRQLEGDIHVRLQLTRNENDIVVLNRGLEELEKRKRVLKDMLKVENKKMGLRGLFRRN